MRLAKSSQEDIDKLRNWLQFNDELSKIDPSNSFAWENFKDDWNEDKDFSPIIKKIQVGEEFDTEAYFDYYHNYISHIHSRIVLGYETLVNSVCDPNKSYLTFNESIEKAVNSRPHERKLNKRKRATTKFDKKNQFF
jgi:hypothetical protein